jgi:hypothetical protein
MTIHDYIERAADIVIAFGIVFGFAFMAAWLG